MSKEGPTSGEDLWTGREVITNPGKVSKAGVNCEF